MLVATRHINRLLASPSGFASEFLNLSERLSRLAARNGVRVEPYRDPSLPAFSLLPVQKRFLIVTSLRAYVDAAEAAAYFDRTAIATAVESVYSSRPLLAALSRRKIVAGLLLARARLSDSAADDQSRAGAGASAGDRAGLVVS